VRCGVPSLSIHDEPPALLPASLASPLYRAAVPPPFAISKIGAPSLFQKFCEAIVEFQIMAFWTYPPYCSKNTIFVTNIGTFHPPSTVIKFITRAVSATPTNFGFFRYRHGIPLNRAKCIHFGTVDVLRSLLTLFTTRPSAPAQQARRASSARRAVRGRWRERRMWVPAPRVWSAPRGRGGPERACVAESCQ